MARKDYIKRQLQHKMNWLKDNTDYHVALMYLQGSQNYNMDVYTDNYKSDFDVKCYIVPTLEDMIQNSKPVSKVIVMEDNSHIEIKDIRLLSELLYKENSAYLEMLYTPYFLINKDYHRVPSAYLNKNLKDMRDEICNRDVVRFLKALKGMAHEERNSLENATETTKIAVEKYGYDPKSLHHLVRMTEMANEVIRLNGKVKFDSLMSLDFLTKPKFNELKKLKVSPISYLDAIRKADNVIEKIDKNVDSFLEKFQQEVDADVEIQMYQYINDFIKFCIQRDIIDEITRKNQEKKLKHSEEKGA